MDLVQQNYDYFMTKAKTNFLIGHFEKAHIDMMLAYSLRSQQVQVKFDAFVIKLIQKILSQINKKQKSQNNLLELVAQTKDIFNIEVQSKFGKIFKKLDYYCFTALIYIFLKKYKEAIQLFQECINEKQKQVMVDMEQEESEDQINLELKTTLSQLQKESNDVKSYNNQMKYNIFICHLMAQNVQSAKLVLNTININQTQTFLDTFCYFKEVINNHSNPKFQKQQIFPNKNKLSQFIKPLIIPNSLMKLKLSIPFPKVQPPEIFPQFDIGLIKAFSIYGVQGKPEAPWVVIQQNSIKFTQKIQKVSRLNFNDSQSSLTQIIDLQKSKISSKTLVKQRRKKMSSIQLGSKLEFIS